MGRPREHGDEIGVALLDAAEALLAKGGPDAVSLRAVADAGHTTTRAVYTVYGSKAGLLQALAARGYRLLERLADTVPVTSDPGVDLVNVGVRGFRRFALDKPHLFRLTFERIPTEVEATPLVEAAATAARLALTKRVQRARAARVIDDDRPEIEVVFGFHSLCLGLATSELAAEPPPVGRNFWRSVKDTDRERLWRDALTALVRGLAPRQTAKPRRR